MAGMLDELTDLGNAVNIMPSEFNASQIKQVISQFHFFIGARTHATIAAFSSGVPTISIAYSVKAKGINKDLLGEIPVVRFFSNPTTPIRPSDRNDIRRVKLPSPALLINSLVSVPKEPPAAPDGLSW